MGDVGSRGSQRAPKRPPPPRPTTTKSSSTSASSSMGIEPHPSRSGGAVGGGGSSGLPHTMEQILGECAVQQLQIDQCKALIRQQEMTLVKLRHQVLRGLSRSQSDTDSSQEVLEDRQKVLEEEIQRIIREQSRSITKLRQDSIKELTDLSPRAEHPAVTLQSGSQGWPECSTFPRRYRGQPATPNRISRDERATQRPNYPLDKSQSHDACVGAGGVGGTQASYTSSQSRGTTSSNSINSYRDHIYLNALDMRKPQRSMVQGRRKKLIVPDGGFSFQKYYAMHKTGSSVKTFHQRLRLGSYSADDILAANENGCDQKSGKPEGLSILHKPWSSLDDTPQRGMAGLEDLGGDYVSLTSVDSLGSQQKKSILSHSSYAKRAVNWDSSSFNSSDDSPFTSCDIPTTAITTASLPERPLASSSPKVSFSLANTETAYSPTACNNINNRVKSQKSQSHDLKLTQNDYENVPTVTESTSRDETPQHDYDVPKSTKIAVSGGEQVTTARHHHLWLAGQRDNAMTPKRPDSLDVAKINTSLKGARHLGHTDVELVRQGLHQQVAPRDTVSCESKSPQISSPGQSEKELLSRGSSSRQKGSSYKGWTRVEQSPSKPKASQDSSSSNSSTTATPQKGTYQGWTRVGSERKAATAAPSSAVKDPMFEFPSSKTEQSTLELQEDACSNCKMSLGQKCYFCRHRQQHGEHRLSRRVSDPNLKISPRYRSLKLLKQGGENKDAATSSEDDTGGSFAAIAASYHQVHHKRSRSYDQVNADRSGLGLRESFRRQIAERRLMAEKPAAIFARQTTAERVQDWEEDFVYLSALEANTIVMQAKEGQLQQLREDLAELTSIEEEMKVPPCSKVSTKSSVKSSRSNSSAKSTATTTTIKCTSDNGEVEGGESSSSMTPHGRVNLFSNESRRTSAKAVREGGPKQSETELPQNVSDTENAKSSSKKIKFCGIM